MFLFLTVGIFQSLIFQNHDAVWIPSIVIFLSPFALSPSPSLSFFSEACSAIFIFTFHFPFSHPSPGVARADVVASVQVISSAADINTAAELHGRDPLYSFYNVPLVVRITWLSLSVGWCFKKKFFVNSIGLDSDEMSYWVVSVNYFFPLCLYLISFEYTLDCFTRT